MPEEPPFTGWVHGREASDLEERTARGIDRKIKQGLVESFHFRKVFFQIPYHVELDILMFAGGLAYPIQVDAMWIHETAKQRAHDLYQDARLNELFSGWQGYQEVSRIIERHLLTPELVDTTLNALLAGRVFRPWEQ